MLADHGESLGEHGEHTHGVFLYDATLRIPFIMAGPGIPAGLRVKQQARTIDFLPTLLEVMGGRAPGYVEGVSLVPVFSGKSVATDISYAETLYPKMNMNWSELRAIRTNRWKYIRAPRPELYDLTSDPGETSNVIQQHGPEVQNFEAHLKKFISPGGKGVEKVETAMLDQRVMDQLKSLGYLAGAGGRSYELTGTGTDPKDAVEILQLIDEAESPGTKLPEAKRIELLQRALAKDPQNPSLYYQLGRPAGEERPLRRGLAAIPDGAVQGHRERPSAFAPGRPAAAAGPKGRGHRRVRKSRTDQPRGPGQPEQSCHGLSRKGPPCRCGARLQMDSRERRRLPGRAERHGTGFHSEAGSECRARLLREGRAARSRPG